MRAALAQKRLAPALLRPQPRPRQPRSAGATPSQPAEAGPLLFDSTYMSAPFYLCFRKRGLTILAGVLTGLLMAAQPARAQADDGFRRVDGTMYVIRNGQQRPMTRDARLPNGRTITRDGFVVARDGQRTELPEGRGCTLLGDPVAVAAHPNGRLSLASSGRAAPGAAPAVFVADRALLAEVQRWWTGKAKGKGRHKKGKHRGRKHD